MHVLANRGWRSLAAAVFAVTFALAGCKGEQGDPGPAGPPGAAGEHCTVAQTATGKTITCPDGTTVTITDGQPGEPGDPGQPGADEGTVTGTVTADIGGPAAAVQVTTTPDVGRATATDAEGAFSLTLPIGTYVLELGSADFVTRELPPISVTAGASIAVAATLARINPIKLVAPTSLQQVGFGEQVALSVGVEGAAAPTYAWTQVSGPTAVTLSSASAASPTFTTATFAEVAASGKVPFLDLPPRPSFLAITNQQAASMSWVFEVVVSEGPFSARTKVTVSPTSWSAGLADHPRGVRIIANDAEAASYDWSLSAPAGSTARLDLATARNPSFVPDAAGTYTLTNSAADPDTVLTLNVATWVGAETETVGCQACHSGGAGGDQYTPWKSTGHASLFRDGLEGLAGDHYNAGCIRCHTLGFNTAPEAANGGFDDVAAAEGWSFPAHPGEGEWNKVPAALKPLGAVQCESCHGPGSGHGSARLEPVRDMMGSGVCGTCHDAPTHHDRFALWAQSAHASRTLALEDGTVEARGATAAHCGRCHTAQGFVAYSRQILDGNGDKNLLKPDGTAADVPYLAGLGMTAAAAEGMTCQACHEPHTLELRLEGDLGKTAAGFTANGVGKGALCIACHNTRNGLHDDAHVVASYSAPHVPSQADVLMGQNAYFVTPGQLGGHAAIGDTCVRCHVSLVPASVAAAATNHTFRADTSTCARCHGEGVTGEAQAARMEEEMEALAAAIGARVLAELDAAVTTNGSFAVRAWDPATDYYSSTGSPAPSNVSISSTPLAAELEDVHGQIGFKLTLAAPMTITFQGSGGASVEVTSAEVHFQLGSLLSGTANPIPNDGAIVKACWNYFLLHGDGSSSIHNPSFVFGVLQATRAALAQ